jgi:type IV secretion system protein VirB1
LDPCTNLAAMETILVKCFDRAARTHTRSPSAGPLVPQAALRQALSCYYSGNFSTGFRHGYVRRVEVAAQRTLQEAP